MAQEYILGIDYGEKRVGLALVHQIARLPRPLRTIANDAALIDHIKQVIGDEGVGQIVVGLPRNMDGSVGFQAESAKAFYDELRSSVTTPVTLTDETLSSVDADDYVDASYP